ncbi:HotDog domain-containing protein [Dichotomopilus funicola]|uniref:HotDog domain-containing protein n=1 Tax=Dichotomopilus funicola TaxID=1934379 RepID=A0AAN6V657_9PEZI|nr:HotDog domain-containing protein [Dichotomopilus funicola]
MATKLGPKLKPHQFVRTLRVTKAQEGVVDFELKIEKDHTNRLKIIHGGTIASLVDLGGSLAVASQGYYATGVTTDLNVTYISSGGKVGDTLTGTAVCDRMGKTLAYTTVMFWDKQMNLVARGSHTKFVAQAVASSTPFTVPEGAPVADGEE